MEQKIEEIIDPRIAKLNSRIYRLELKRDRRAIGNFRKFKIQKRIDALYEQLKPLVREDMEKYKEETAVKEIPREAAE